MEMKFTDGMAEKLAIPEESMAAVPITEVRGKRSVCVENHNGILEYTDECVKVAVKRGAISIFGSKLSIARMTRHRVEIRGNIRSVEFE